MVDRYKIHKHPMLGKRHTLCSRLSISLATKGSRNPVFGKKHAQKTKDLISFSKRRVSSLCIFMNIIMITESWLIYIVIMLK